MITERMKQMAGMQLDEAVVDGKKLNSELRKVVEKKVDGLQSDAFKACEKIRDKYINRRFKLKGSTIVFVVNDIFIKWDKRSVNPYDISELQFDVMIAATGEGQYGDDEVMLENAIFID